MCSGDQIVYPEDEKRIGWLKKFTSSYERRSQVRGLFSFYFALKVFQHFLIDRVYFRSAIFQTLFLRNTHTKYDPSGMLSWWPMILLFVALFLMGAHTKFSLIIRPSNEFRFVFRNFALLLICTSFEVFCFQLSFGLHSSETRALGLMGNWAVLFLITYSTWNSDSEACKSSTTTDASHSTESQQLKEIKFYVSVLLPWSFS